MSWNVFITARTFTKVGKPALELLRNAGCRLVMPEVFGPYPPAKLLETMPGMDAALISPDAYNAEVLASPQLSNLKIISRWGVGYDSIDINAATKNGVVVAYTPGLLNETVADYSFGLLLSIARRIHEASNFLRQGQWTNCWGHDVNSKTLGIIGCGRIGQAVARRASGFNMRVIGYDVATAPSCDNIQFVSLDELLSQSDFVSLHCALTAENRGLIGEAQLRKMKPDSYLINTARGPLIDEPALIKALTEGWIAGAALDVFAKEPMPPDHPFRNTPNLLLSPHNCSFAHETAERVCMAAAQAIVDLMQGRKPTWVVDPKVFDQPNLRAPVRA